MQARKRDIPFTYLGVMIHSKTHMKELVDVLFELGQSISYDRVMSISTSLGNNLCQYFEMEKAVCPTEFKEELFTTAVIDNIHHNLSSTTAQDSFNGIGISQFQHPRCEASGVEHTTLTDLDNSLTSSNKGLDKLPQSCTDVLPVTLSKKDPVSPKLQWPNKSDCLLIPQAMLIEYRYTHYIYIYITISIVIHDV